jgi:hypothetical protein
VIWSSRVAFVPVTRGSEFWNNVLECEKTLQKRQPDTNALKAWEETNKSKV